VWYSGTPEPDLFKRPPGSSGTLCNGGTALVVDIASARAAPTVLPVEVGRYRWHQVMKTLTEDSQIDLLEAELRALDEVGGRANQLEEKRREIFVFVNLASSSS
jgi:hypothetical protein